MNVRGKKAKFYEFSLFFVFCFFINKLGVFYFYSDEK